MKEKEKQEKELAWTLILISWSLVLMLALRIFEEKWMIIVTLSMSIILMFCALIIGKAFELLTN